MWLKGEKAPDPKAGEKAKKLFELIDCTQKDFCGRHEVSVTTLSSAINGTRPVPDDTWRRVLKGFQEELGERLGQKADPLNSGTAQALLDDLFQSSGGPTENVQATPGGPVPIGARVYIDRPCDTEIIQALNRGQRLFAVTGAPQTGRSSLIYRIAAWAEEAGFSATVVDFEDFRSNLKTMSGEQLLTAIASRMLIETAGTPDKHQLSSAFLQQIAKRPERTLLVLDHVDNAAMEDLGKIWDVLLFLIKLRNDFASHAPNKFVAISAFGVEAWSAVAGSAFGNVAYPVETPCLTEAQVFRLGEAVIGSNPDYHAVSQVFSLFGGHPYLTHLFFDDLRQGMSIQAITEAALALKGFYGRHADRVVRRVKSVATSPLSGTNLGLDFPVLCRELSGQVNDLMYAPRIFKWLQLFGVIASDGKIPDLYRHAFAQQVTTGESR
jgi:hypothetical protein